MSMGKVYFPRQAPWSADLVSELLHFPTAKTDDQVDVLSLFGRMLDKMVAGRLPPKPKKMEMRGPTFDELLAMQPKPDPEHRPRI